MNHYEILNVSKGATPEEIKRAYRLMAKQYHPDKKDGDKDKMIAVQIAYDTLSNPKRRERYDQTGDNGPGPSIEKDAVDMLAGLFASYIESGSEQENALATIRTGLTANKKRIATHIEQIQKNIAKIERKRKLIKRKSAGFDLFDGVLTQKISQLNENIYQNKHQSELIDAVLVLVEEYECHVIEMPPDPFQGLKAAYGMDRATSFKNIFKDL